ncbi:MAG: hypothetical protein SV186_02530 [Candidatus Nanohaloarchaea archaeon]|nr:hypothetical protein [Candidatus Nanohaloarchaea archaeon]
MHTLLFGKRNFLLFPLIILLLSIPGYWALVASGFALAEVRIGLHYMTFFLGLNVGAIGFVSRDAIKNLLGESNLLIFSSRTLPVSRFRLVATFLAKDLLYYSFLFLIPLIAGIVPVTVYSSGSVGIDLALLWFTVSGMFLVGVGASFMLASLYNRGKLFLLAGLTGLGLLLWYFRSGILAFTPLSFYHEPFLSNLFFGFTPTLVMIMVGLMLFKPRFRHMRRTYRAVFSGLHRRLERIDDTGLVTKFLLDIRRSSGGLLKLVFSVGVILAVFVFLAEQIFFAQGFMAAPALSFALILSIASVSVYNWINRFDKGDNYLKFPVGFENVFYAKYVTYFLLATPIIGLYLLLIGYMYGFQGGVTGAVVLLPLMLYLLGTTAYLTGLEPNRLLLNGTYFLAYTLVMGVAFVPLFIWSLVYSLVPLWASGVMVLGSFMLGWIGYRLCLKAPGRWKERELSG